MDDKKNVLYSQLSNFSIIRQTMNQLFIRIISIINPPDVRNWFFIRDPKHVLKMFSK